MGSRNSSTRAGWIVASIASLALASTMGSGHAAGPHVSFTTRLTGQTPFADNCGDPGTAIADSEVESSLAVDPRDADHLVVAWQQDRYTSGGGARSNISARSLDGGATWTKSFVPGISTCTAPGHVYTRATDPRVAIGPDGTSYLLSLAFNSELPSNGIDWPGAQYVSTSTGGAHVWNAPVAVEKEQLYEEQPQIAVDPVTPGRAYMIWERLVWPGVDGHTRFARTDDGGKTWTEPITVAPDIIGQDEAPFGGLIAAPRPDGSVSLVLIVASQSGFRRTQLFAGPYAYYSLRSDDLGATWSLPTLIVASAGAVPSGDAETLTKFRGGEGFPHSALSPDGTIYVAWGAATVDAGNVLGTDIHVARSTDLGATWKDEVVKHVPNQAFDVAVAVAGDGTVGLTWYDARNDVFNEGGLTTELWFASSATGTAPWAELRVAGPFDLRQGPKTVGWMLGDYHGMVGFPNGFGVSYSAPPPMAVTGPSDLFFSKISLRGGNGRRGSKALIRYPRPTSPEPRGGSASLHSSRGD